MRQSMRALQVSLASACIWPVMLAAEPVVFMEPMARVELYNDWVAIPAGLPKLTEKNFESLEKGKIISYRERLTGDAGSGYRVSAYIIVKQPRLRVWVATLASTQRHARKLTEVPVKFDQKGGAVWYQYLSMPWPFADRHWLLQTHKNQFLAAATDGYVWEHKWVLAKDDRESARVMLGDVSIKPVTDRQYERAVYLPVNSGGWAMINLEDDKTLVAVYATAELGGRLPDGMVARFIVRQLKQTLGDLDRRAQIADKALAESEELHTGAGTLIVAGDLAALEDGL